MKKEKIDRKLTMVIQPSLMIAFQDKCAKKYKKVSEVIRELMSKYVNGEI
jgi:hypothetical protein